MQKRVMLTGATGYLGQAVLKELLAGGHQVRAFVRDPSRLDPKMQAQVEVCRGDLMDLSSLIEAMRGVDDVLHLAGLVSDWVPDDRLFFKINVQGTQNLLQALWATGVPRLLLTSTVMVFGPTDGLHAAHEETPPPARRFFLPYQATKAQALELCRKARSEKLAVSVLFPGALYGPGPTTDGNYLARLMKQLLEGRLPCLPRATGRRWCLAHVEDVARAHRLALERGPQNGEFILGGENVTFARMLEKMQAGLGLGKLPPRVPGWLLLAGLPPLLAAWALSGQRPPITLGGARVLLHDWAFSSRKARARLGYASRPFADGFPPFVEWFTQEHARLGHDMASP